MSQSLPAEWEQKLLPDVADIINGKAHEQFITEQGEYVLINAKFISTEGRVQKKTNKNLLPAKVGDIILVMSDVPNGKALAKCFLVDEDRRYAVNQSVCAIRPKRAHPSFLFYFLNRNSYFLGFDDGIQQTHLLSNVFKRCPVQIPRTKEEQVAIAEVLSDVDGLLGGLDRLIAKKRDLKQAAMQQLLTGQTRLPGFHGEWAVKRLDELAEIRSGGTPSTGELRFWDGDIPWCTPTDITALNGGKYLGETARMITQFGLKASSAEMIPAHSVVMTSRATIGECAINAVPVTTNQGFKNFIPFATTDVEFLYYLLGTQKQGFISLCGGSTFLEIGKIQLSAYKVRLPDTKSEQTAIAELLTDMDAELAALAQRREKTHALKQAMTQELLTGRTRLV